MPLPPRGHARAIRSRQKHNPMNYAEYCYGPLDEVLNSLAGDNPPSDPIILRMVLTRCVSEIIQLQAQVQRLGNAR